MSDFSRAAIVRIVATTLVAAAVPVLCWVAMGRSARGEDLQLLTRVVLLSVAFWAPASAWLVLERPGNAFVRAAVIGLLSPLLAAALAVVVGMALLPVDFLLGVPAATISLSYHGVLAMMVAPHLLFPVGLAMGVLVFVIATAGTNARDPAVRAPLPG